MTLQEYMADRSLTDAELAKLARVSRPYVSRIRRGEREPSLAVAVRLAEATKLPVRTFLKDGVG